MFLGPSFVVVALSDINQETVSSLMGARWKEAVVMIDWLACADVTCIQRAIIEPLTCFTKAVTEVCS